MWHFLDLMKTKSNMKKNHQSQQRLKDQFSGEGIIDYCKRYNDTDSRNSNGDF